MSHNSFQTMKVWSTCTNSLTTLFCCMFLIWQLIIAKLFWVVFFFFSEIINFCFSFRTKEFISEFYCLLAVKNKSNPCFSLRLVPVLLLIYIIIYTIAQVILAFWLVLTYDLLEDRGTTDVIITEFFLLHFKMAERSEN